MSFKLAFLNDIKLLYENEIKDIPEDSALDSIIYGIRCYKIKKGSSYKGILSLSDKIPDHLCFSNKEKNKIKIFQIKNITSITFNSKNENLKNYTIQNKNEEFMQININQKTYDFSFNKKDKLLFIKGLITLFNIDDLIGHRRKDVDNYMEENINTLFNKNDDNFDNLLDETEFKKLAQEIGIEPKELLLYIDLNKDGIITKQEIMNYFKSIISGSEFENIFTKYSSIKDIEGSKENVMSPMELKKFFHDIEKEPISDLEAYQLVINFKSSLSNKTKRKMCKKFQNIFFYNKYKVNNDKINKAMHKLNKKIKNKEKNILNKNYIFENDNNDNEIKLELNLKEFSNMLNSFLLAVYNKKKQTKELDTSHPLTDYYINSSHNTYLKGHQLKGYSDPKMYAFAVLMGFRLVELDCYNGQNDDIIITHGYTLVTKLKLEDVLKELKENAFKNSPYPVILSIENHLDKKHQKILAEKFQKYLVDLYIFPYNSPPKKIPTLEELKNKFIIKCGGKRLYEDEDIPLNTNTDDNVRLRGVNKDNNIQKYILEDNYDEVSDSDEDEESMNIDEFNNINHEIIVDRERFIEKIKEKKNIMNETKEDIVENILKNSIIKSMQDNPENSNENFEFSKISEKSKINISNEKELFFKKDIEYDFNNEEDNKNIKEEEYINNLINISEKKKENDEMIELPRIEQNEKEENEYITCLENVRGLLGQKFKYEKIEAFNYKHWEFVTLKSNLYLNIFQNIEKRKKIIELSFHCMMKAYPQKFDSSNYDIIKCWCCGCQTAAINIQAVEDDYTLFNKIFFTQNNNYGYILKPKKLLLNTFELEYYKEPKFILKIQIINLFNFSKLAEIAEVKLKEHRKMEVKIYSLGPYTENDEINTKNYKNEYIFDIVGGLLTPTIVNNKIIKIPVYEEELGGIMIKFLYDNFVIGRGCIPYCLMKMGYRKIPIYDNNSILRESIFVVGVFEREL